MLTYRRLRKALEYDPKTGVFMWLVSQGRQGAGAIAGTMRPDGYVKINIDGRPYMAQHLAWFYVTKRWPKKEIDHRFGIRDDNRFSELREATSTQNRHNQHRIRRDNSSGTRGVSWDKSREKWVAMITLAGHQKNLGRFTRKEAAEAAYRQAKRQMHPFATLYVETRTPKH